MFFFFFFKQKTAYEMRISDWSSDVCSSDLLALGGGGLLSLDTAFAAQAGQKLAATPNPEYWLSNKQTAETDVSSYNNFYEFGTGKTDPYEYADKIGRAHV